MYLKSLELEGFKSFVDATELTFNNGFTAIVGPNGCGKSNVSDAIRWVIGEQSSKSLRGTRITDLIFNGSRSRKPVNRTEISLTLSHVPPGIRIANVPNISEEVKVTRCYHRSGESEFYINQVPCRLKDITDFLLDCGISPKVLTVIEQGHIQDIITSKPEDRRILIEEAAGILKFKQRRSEALRKLDASQLNLDRISDIVQELHRQVESLKRQAAKAERYKKYQGEIKNLSLKLFAKKTRRYAEELKTIEADWNSKTELKAQRSAKVSTLENEIAKLNIEIEELSASLNRKKDKIHELGGLIGKNENAIQIRNSQIEQAQADIEAADEENRQMNEDIDALSSRVEEQRLALGKISSDLNELEGSLEERNQALENDRKSLRQCEAEAKSGEERVLALYHRISQKKNDLTALETRTHFLQTRTEKLKEEQAETQAQANGCGAALKESESEHGKKLGRLSSLKEEQQTLEKQAADCRKQHKTELERLSALKEEYLTQSSLLSSLQELRSKFEGFQDGIKSLMTYNANGGQLTGLREVLVDVLQAPEEYETAIEAVLGEKLQSVIVDSFADTVEAIDYLKHEQCGRGSFIPLQSRSPSFPPLMLNGNTGVVGKILDFIECKEEYRPILEKLLGNVVLVQDLQTALQLHEDPNFHGTTVTRNGETIDPQGLVTGGSVRENSTGLLARNREIEKLAETAKRLKEDLQTTVTAEEQSQGNLNRLETDIKQIAMTVHETEIVKTNSQKDLEQLQKEIERLQQKHATLEYERSAAAHELHELTAQKDALLHEMKQAEEEKVREEEQLATLNRDMESRRENLENQSAEISGIKVLIASLKGKRENTLTEIKRIDLEQENLRQRIQKRETDQRDNRNRIEEARSAIAGLENQILEQSREKDRVGEERVREEESLQSKDETLKQKDQETRTLAKEIQELTEALSKIEIKRSEIKIQTAHLEEKAFDDFNATREEMMRAYDEGIDVAEIETQVRELKGKVDRMGGVNLAALSDFQEANERYTFLKTQQEDLAQSIMLLHETIEKIDRNTKQRFVETFEQVNQNFKEIFARLFEGGKAELKLSDPSVPLESGIEIVANPLGKTMQNLSLLSGGEKSLTAIALIFGVFKVRPSPFCLLDEVDAPLDEANVIRFQEMLREMAVNTQFILITHNQKTMSFADVLYGITMEERGVSKAVSVTFN